MIFSWSFPWSLTCPLSSLVSQTVIPEDLVEVAAPQISFVICCISGLEDNKRSETIISLPINQTKNSLEDKIKRGKLWSFDMYEDMKEETSSVSSVHLTLGEIWGHISVTWSEARGPIQEAKAGLLSLMWDPQALVAAHLPDRSASSVCSSTPGGSGSPCRREAASSVTVLNSAWTNASASCCSYDKRMFYNTSATEGRFPEHHFMKTTTKVSVSKLTLLWHFVSFLSFYLLFWWFGCLRGKV